MKIALFDPLMAVRKCETAHKQMHSLYRYMYLKTYAKFTFRIKSPGHVSDENFLLYRMHLASKISSYGV